MCRRRAFLVWLLAALILSAGLPIRSTAARGDAGGSCCQPGTCTCDAKEPQGACGCARPTAPRGDERAPRAPAPRGIESIQLAVAPEPDPFALPKADQPRAPPVARLMRRPPGVMPWRSRQVVFSIWRC